MQIKTIRAIKGKQLFLVQDNVFGYNKKVTVCNFLNAILILYMNQI